MECLGQVDLGWLHENPVLKEEVCAEYPGLEAQLGSCGGEVWGVVSNAHRVLLDGVGDFLDWRQQNRNGEFPCCAG